MEIEVTAELVAQVLGLLTVIMTGLFAYVQDKYTKEKEAKLGEVQARAEAEAQGDLILASAKSLVAVGKALAGPDKQQVILAMEKVLSMMETGWNDAKVGTPEMEVYFDQLQGLVEALLK